MKTIHRFHQLTKAWKHKLLRMLENEERDFSKFSITFIFIFILYRQSSIFDGSEKVRKASDLDETVARDLND